MKGRVKGTVQSRRVFRDFKEEYYEDHGPIWETEDPSLLQCCLCNKKLVGKPILELRSTGPAGKQQLWAYCPPCAIAHMGKPLHEEGFARIMQHYDGNTKIAGEDRRSTRGYRPRESVLDISGKWLLPTLQEMRMKH